MAAEGKRQCCVQTADRTLLGRRVPPRPGRAVQKGGSECCRPEKAGPHGRRGAGQLEGTSAGFGTFSRMDAFGAQVCQWRNQLFKEFKEKNSLGKLIQVGEHMAVIANVK